MCFCARQFYSFKQRVAGSSPARLIMSPSSSLAQDTGLSRRQHGFKSRRGRQQIHEHRMARFDNGLIAEGECAAVLLVDHLCGATDVVRNSFQYLAALHRLGDESVAGRREFPRSDL